MPELEPYPTPLAQVRAQPYRVPLDSATPPEAVLAGLAGDDHPGALWGNWFGGGLVVVRRPLRRHEPRLAADAFGRLDDLPVVGADRFDGIGGGWLVALGYDPGHSWIGFYDSVLRWRAGDGWWFESLGLARPGGRRCRGTGGLAGDPGDGVGTAAGRADRGSVRGPFRPARPHASTIWRPSRR